MHTASQDANILVAIHETKDTALRSGDAMWSQSCEQYKHVAVDAEMKATVVSYADGRLITYYRATEQSFNTLVTSIAFPDGTSILISENQPNVNVDPDSMTTPEESKLIVIKKNGYPTFEVDYYVDSTALNHSRGLQVPIKKGGDQVRSKVALNDGSALIVSFSLSNLQVYN